MKQRQKSAGWICVVVATTALAEIANTTGQGAADDRFKGGPYDGPTLLREGENLVFVKDGRPHASIVVATNAEAATAKAAGFLQQTIRRMSGAMLDIRDDSRDWSGAQILVGPSRLNPISVPQGAGEPQGYRIAVSGRQVALAGNDAAGLSGTAYAVFDLLRQWGCEWFAPDPLYQVIPSNATLTLADCDRVERPAFDGRALVGFDESIMSWRLGGARLETQHNYYRILPPAEYAKAHPEYYSEIGGKRVDPFKDDWQMCFANPDVQRITVAYARRFLDGNPDYLTVSLSGNDSAGRLNFCECAGCRAMGGNAGERTLAFANIVARELAKTHPGKMVCFYAYADTLAAPPSDIQAEPNVMVMVCSQSCHAHALEDPRCEINAGWRRNFERWVATRAKVAIYEYYIPHEGGWRQVPWQSTEVAYRNLRYWRERGVRWIDYLSGDSSLGGNWPIKDFPRRWLLYYMAARGMWTPDEDPNRVVREVCDRLFGPAGKTMSRYFGIQAEAPVRVDLHNNNWGMPPGAAVFTPSVRAELRVLLNQAMREAGGDPLIWRRVAREVTLWSETEQALGVQPAAGETGGEHK